MSNGQQQDIDAKDATRQTQLMWACRQDAMEEVRRLLEQKASVNIYSWIGGEAMTALSVAVLQSSTDLVKLLLENRAVPNLVLGRRGHQPLSLAAQLGDVEKMRLLLEAKALVAELPRGKDTYGQYRTESALLHASRAGHPAAVSFLLNCQASIGFRDQQDLSALMHVVSMCPSTDASRYVEVADILLKSGMSACDRLVAKDAGIPKGRSVLMMACKSANVSMLRLLLANRASAEINATDSSGASALTLSIWRGCPEIVQLLLESHADAQKVNHKGESAACYAQKMQSSLLIRDLVGRVAEPDLPPQKKKLLDRDEKRRRTVESDVEEMFDPSTDQRNGKVDLSALSQTGTSSWVFHQGRAINLEDETDTASLSEDEFAMLLAEACAKNERPTAALEKVPLQSWELEKMVQIAQQTMAAIESGRYTPEYGDVLLTTLRGWPGDAHWLEAEVQRIEDLLTGKDHSSLQALKQEINDSLVSTLREVQKNLHSVGLEIPSHGVKDAEASCPAEPYMEKCAVCHGSGELLPEVCPLCEGDPRFVKGTSSSSGCDHACDVISHRQGLPKTWCCHCACRRLHTELFEGLKAWWHSQSIETPDIRQADSWRFFCGSCYRRWSGMEQAACSSRTDMQQSLSIPVPFGGRVLCVTSSAMNAEAVQPSCIRRHGSDAHSRTAMRSTSHNDSNDAPSEAGSWTWLFDSDDGSWEIIDECEAST